MTKLQLIRVIGITSIVVLAFWYVIVPDRPPANAIPSKENSVIDLVEIPVEKHEKIVLGSSLNGNTEKLLMSQANNNSYELLPHEVAVWNDWAEERGYDLNGGLTGSYNSMSDEALLTLAGQNDAKAHYVLAGRILAIQSVNAEGFSPETISKIEHHLYSASVLGYTSSINVLTELALRRAKAEDSTDKELIVTAYKYALTNVERGDQNAEAVLASLKSVAPLSNDDYAKASENSISFYNELSEKRDALGLPAFNNETPPEVLAFTMRTR